MDNVNFGLLGDRILKETLNEYAIGIPTKKHHLAEIAKHKKPKSMSSQYMLIRTREEAARGGSPVGHGPSVKVYHSKGNSVIGIPTRADAEFKQLDQFMNANGIDKAVKSVSRSIVYDNQMLIVAYWYCEDRDGPIGTTLFDMILENIIVNDYAKNPVNYRKSQDELDIDKKEITDEVRKRLQNDTVSINFGK